MDSVKLCRGALLSFKTPCIHSQFIYFKIFLLSSFKIPCILLIFPVMYFIKKENNKHLMISVSYP
jgi:hypothetical protein